MKTQKYGHWRFPFPFISIHKPWVLQFSNGHKNLDSPSRAFPETGTYTWEQGGLRDDGNVYGEEQADGTYIYKLRYDESPDDRAWMEERDRNYVFRLEREGKLDQVEPNLCTEVPKLYEEVMKHRVERQAKLRAQEEARKKAEAQQKREAEEAILLAEAEQRKKEAERLAAAREAERKRKAEEARLAAEKEAEKKKKIEEKEFDQSYLIPYEKLEWGSKLGQGGYGIVFKGTWQHIPVAIKKLHLNQLSGHVLQEFKAEASVMTKLHHLNILTLYGVSIDNPGNYSMVIEYMPKGSLYQLLHNDNPLSWDLRYHISMDICAGLLHLHEKNILHRDLKSVNVLLDENMRAKLSDFGLSKLKSETTTATATLITKSAVGTVSWMAPELFKRNSKHNKASDIYSLGMVFWEIASRMLPFKDAQDPQLIIAWKKDGENEDIPEDCPNEYGDMIKECWKEQNARPSVEVLIKSLEKIFNPQQGGAAQLIHQSGPIYQFETKKNVDQSGPVYQM